ncbi:MAG TPA: DUF3943 domain-containing protein [Burkholderiaceae bacterium]|nr:DUF3943 domain-containing protein [Burkholderiaceae bacterium]
MPRVPLPIAPLHIAAALGWVLGACAAVAQQSTGAEASTGEASNSDKSYTIPALEIIGFDFLLNRYNHRFSGTSDYDVSLSSIRRNLRGPWVVDNDPFKVNQFAHPYQGSLYHGAARASGLGYWESAALTFAGSAFWEIAGERTPPSRNDQIASGIAGSFLGEPLFRMAHLMLKNRSEVPYVWREWGAALISPPVGLNRLVFGPRFDGTFSDHDPIYYGRVRLGSNHATREELGTSSRFKRSDAQIDFAMDYGLPGKPGYTYDRPFDYFAFQAVVSSANGMENLNTHGLMFGTDYAIGQRYRGIWGLYANYDYLAPQIFHVSTTALSLGTTGQWWASREVALQGTVLAGIGYSAASTSRGVVGERDYHYGTTPRLGLAFRVTASARVSADISAQKYFLGHIANRSAGRDDISHVDAALTWRIHGRHAIGVKYVWSHRNASYPDIGERKQTLATAGIYYTLLGLDTFGTVDWRDADSK